MGTGAAIPFTHIRLGSRTDVGKVRGHNEDNLLWFIPQSADEPRADMGAVCVVADGMGGHAAGEVASKIAVDTIVEQYTTGSGPDVGNALKQAIESANTAIQEQQAGGRAGMGTTVACVAVRGDDLFVAHVGDSRAYLLRDGRLMLLTQDHSLVGEQVRQGLITDEEAYTSEHRHIITRALGLRDAVTVDLAGPIKLCAGDTILLCTDGVCGYVRDEQIQYILDTHRADPQSAADLLVEAANAAGGFDNATAAILCLEQVAPDPAAHINAAPSPAHPADDATRAVASASNTRRILIAGTFALLLMLTAGLAIGLATGGANMRLTAPPASTRHGGDAILVASIQPVKPLGALDDLAPLTMTLPSTGAETQPTVYLTLTLRTNATLVGLLAISRDVVVDKSGNQVRIQLEPQAAFSSTEQVKIEVLAATDGTREADASPLGVMGVPAKTRLLPGMNLDAFIVMRFAEPNQSASAKVRLTVNWEGTGRVPGAFRPAIDP